MSYVIDTNVFIEAKDEWYGFDFCPAFWDWLVDANRDGRAFSIEQVENELQGIDDGLSQWSRDREKGFFLPTTPTVLTAYRSVANWTASQKYEPGAIQRFLRG